MKLCAKSTVAGICLALCVAGAQAAPLVLQDNWVRAGVSDLYGTLGSNGTVSPGILFDPTGTSAYGINDFLTPGTPFEGFYLTASGANWGNNNDGDNTGINSPYILTALSATHATAESTTTDGVLSIKHEYTLSRVSTQSVITIKTTITNTSATAVTNLKALRTLDPDPDVNAYGVFNTINTVPTPSRACGEGARTGEVICITTSSAAYSPRAGVSRSWSTDPAVYLAGVNDGDGDWTIGLAFDIGTLAPGASAVLDYSYLLSDKLDNIIPVVPTTAASAIPTLNELALALLALTLAGGATLGLRRKVQG
jgi:hypothetical protein